MLAQRCGFLHWHGVPHPIHVSFRAQTLNNIDATIGNAFNNEMIQALPSEGRNVPDLLSLQPSVLYLGRVGDQQSDSRSGSVDGARSDQTNVTLDGLDDNNQEQDSPSPPSCGQR